MRFSDAQASNGMTELQVIVLAIVQGLTEFLPISSSGHLVLVPAFLRLGGPGTRI